MTFDPPFDEQYAVSAETAVAYLNERARKHGGAARLWSTALLLPVALIGLPLLATASPMGLLGLGAGTLLTRNLVQNKRAITLNRLLAHVAELPKPLVAEVRGHMLWIGSPRLERTKWGGIRISQKDEAAIRSRAIPSARLIRDGKDE